MPKPIKLMVRSGTLYIEYTLARGVAGWSAPPEGWIPAIEKPDPPTPWRGWKPVGHGPNEARIRSAWRRFLRDKPRRVLVSSSNGGQKSKSNYAVGRAVENGHYILSGGKITLDETANA
jgi:hypothetical protein